MMGLKHRLKSSVFNDDILSTLYKEKERSQPKVCFLSGKERNTLHGGHTRFDCEYNREILEVAPNSYDVDKILAFNSTFGKVLSNAGYGGLASKTPRFVYPSKEMKLSSKRTESKIQKQRSLSKKEVKKAKPPPPFGSAVPRVTGVMGKKDDAPDFHYDISRAYRKREMDFDHSFGGRTKLKPQVIWKCTPENTDICGICEKKPHGDYYISGSGSNVLCFQCFNSEWNKPTKHSRKQLETFKTIRDCSDIHEHAGTTAAIPLVSDSDIRKQRILESYFATFASPRKVIRKLNQATPKCQFAKNHDNKLTVLFEGKMKEQFLKCSA